MGRTIGVPNSCLQVETEAVSKKHFSYKRKKMAQAGAKTTLEIPQAPLEKSGGYYQAAAERILARQRQLEEQVDCSVSPSPTEGVASALEKAKELKVIQTIRVPAKAPDDDYFRIEQNLGCELPVCVANRSDVKNEAIEIRSGDDVTYRLVRAADSLLAAPEHHPTWLWFLDRCHAAFRAGHKEAPRIALNLPELALSLGRTPDGRWYADVDEAFKRFSSSIIKAGQILYLGDKNKVVSAHGAFGTLCNYVSWRTENAKERHSLVDGVDGWVQPGPFVWESIRQGYLKAIPLLEIRRIKAYVAQRLYLYLSKHCRPGGQFKVSVNKLLPKIPMKISKNIKEKLKTHHGTLQAIGFLAFEPVYEGRGANLMVIYQRCS
jgi:hypothetical protein